MIKNIYLNKNSGIPYVSLLLLITCSIVSLPTYFDPRLYSVFATYTQPIYFWQWFSGVFEHCIVPRWFFWPHYLGNMSVIILFGIFIEKILGTKKMAALSLSAGTIGLIAFHLLSEKFSNGTMAGASGIVWAYAPIAFYMLLQLWKEYKKILLKDSLFYIMVFEFFFIWVFITAASSWDGTNRWHVVSTVVGLMFLMKWKNFITEHLKITCTAAKTASNTKSKSDKIIIGTLLVFPLSMLLILGFYKRDKLDKLFVTMTHISPHSTLEEINTYNGKIEITFHEPISAITGTRTNTPGDGLLKFNIDYTEDRKTILLSFGPPLLEELEGSSITIISGESISGKQIKPFTLVFQ